jgi:hypothetical protein
MPLPAPANSLIFCSFSLLPFQILRHGVAVFYQLRQALLLPFGAAAALTSSGGEGIVSLSYVVRAGYF